MFRHITAVVLFVHDFQKCLTFYRDVIGLPVAQLEAGFVAFKMQDQDFALQEIPASGPMVGVGLEDFEPMNGKLQRALLCTRVDNVDAAYETLKERGVVFTRGPVDQAWGIRCIYFRDPEGNLWEFAQPIVKNAD